MKTFEFCIIASGLDPDAEDFEDRFFNAGCDDATLSFQKGHIILDFAREAESLPKALASAVANVRAAGAKVGGLEPDPLVSLSDIAARSDLTRAAVSNYAKGARRDNFPAPVERILSDSPLYDWYEVASWMAAHNQIRPDIAIAAGVFQEAKKAIACGEANLATRLEGRAEKEKKVLEAA